jgi:hypothetical protein
MAAVLPPVRKPEEKIARGRDPLLGEERGARVPDTFEELDGCLGPDLVREGRSAHEPNCPSVCAEETKFYQEWNGVRDPAYSKITFI